MLEPPQIISNLQLKLKRIPAYNLWPKLKGTKRLLLNRNSLYLAQITESQIWDTSNANRFLFLENISKLLPFLPFPFPPRPYNF